jgi:hypothetical protein
MSVCRASGRALPLVHWGRKTESAVYIERKKLKMKSVGKICGRGVLERTTGNAITLNQELQAKKAER